MIIIDIEASGLSDESYPIEYGFIDQDRGIKGSSLINPESVDDWSGYWDDVSELHCHGISYNQLIEEGESGFVAALNLNRYLKDCTVYCDALEWDRFWIDRLFDGVGIDRLFFIDSIYSLIKEDFVVSAREIIKHGDHCFSHRALDDCLGIEKGLDNIPEHYWVNGKPGGFQA